MQLQRVLEIENIAIGRNTFSSLTIGEQNIGIGYKAGDNFASGNNNIKIGANNDAAADAPLDTGDNNVFIGNEAGNQAGGSNNTYIGFQAGSTDGTVGNRNILIGDNIQLPNLTGSNQLNIGNTIFGTGINQATAGNVGIGTNAPTEKLHVVGGNVRTDGSFITSISTYADYVFEDYLEGNSEINKAYDFKTLEEVEAFIKVNKHLPGVTGISDIEKTDKGYTVNMSALSMQVLEKVEELFLYTIEQQNTLKAQQKALDEKEARIKNLEERLAKIEALLLEQKKD